MPVKLPETIHLGTAVMLVAREHAKRLAKDYPEGSREGQARAAVNTSLVELGVDVGDDWQELEALTAHRAWSRAVMQAVDAPAVRALDESGSRNYYTGHDFMCGCPSCAVSRSEG